MINQVEATKQLFPVVLFSFNFFVGSLERS